MARTEASGFDAAVLGAAGNGPSDDRRRLAAACEFAVRSALVPEQNPDVAKAGKDPVVHYLRSGARKGRNPSPQFDGNWYLAKNPDVAAAGMNPLVHYVSFGAAEGRRGAERVAGPRRQAAGQSRSSADPSKTYAKWIPAIRFLECRGHRKHSEAYWEPRLSPDPVGRYAGLQCRGSMVAGGDRFGP